MMHGKSAGSLTNTSTDALVPNSWSDVAGGCFCQHSTLTRKVELSTFNLIKYSENALH